MANRIHSIIIPNKGDNINLYGRHMGYGGLRHPKYIAEFTRATECSLVKLTEDGRFKLERHSQSSRRHLLKKYENRKFRHGIKKQTLELINDNGG